MRLSMDILAADLKDCLLSAQVKENAGMELEGVHFFESGIACDRSLLYLASALPEEGFEDCSFLYLGPARERFPAQYNVLAVKEDFSRSALFNRVLDRFRYYTRWEQTLKELLNRQAPFEEFLDVSQEVLRAGIVLMDWEHNTVAVTRKVKMENCPLWDAILDGYGYKYKFMVEHSLPKLSNISRRNVMEQNWSNLDNRYLYNAPLRINGFPMFGLGLHKLEEPEVPFGKATTQLFSILVGVMEARLNMENRTHPSRGLLYDSFIRDMINGNIQNPDELNRQNEYIPLAEGDHLILGIVSFKNVNYRSAFLRTCARELELLCPGSVCSVIDCRLLWVVNLKDQVDFAFVSPELKNRVRRWLREKDACCGFSASLSSLQAIQDHYQQALSALQCGMACSGEAECMYSYFDRLDYQLIRLAAAKTDVRTLIHPLLWFLMEFDKANKTSYYETLKVYLLNEYSLIFNEIADKLYIHRNTLHYRLDKIQEIAGMDFKDALFKRQLLLSIYCFDPPEPVERNGQSGKESS